MNQLSLDFVNSSWYITHGYCKDMLKDAELLLAFLKQKGLDTDMPPHSEDLDALMALRELLQQAFERVIAGKDIGQDTLEKLQSLVALSSGIRTWVQHEKKYRPFFQPFIRDWNWVISEISFSFIDLLSACDAERLRMCENPDCRWLFYDETKSRTKRCCDENCSTLMKVRRFRARQKNKK